MRIQNSFFSTQALSSIVLVTLGIPLSSYGMTPEELNKVQEQITWMQQVQGRAKLDNSPQAQKILSILPAATELAQTITSKFSSSEPQRDSLYRANGFVKYVQGQAKENEGYKRYFRKKTDSEKKAYAMRDDLKKQVSNIDNELAPLLKQFQKQIAIVQTYDKQAQKQSLKTTLEHPHTQEFRSKCLRENIAGVEKPATGILGFLHRIFGKPAIGHLSKADLEGKTLLISAVLNVQEDLIAAYIQQHGDLNVKGSNPSDPATFGKTPTEIALEQGKYKIAQMLIEGGADLTEAANSNGRRMIEVVTDIATPKTDFWRVKNPKVVGNAEFRNMVRSIVNKTSTRDLVGASNGAGGDNLGKDLLQWSLDNGHGDVAIELIKKGIDLRSEPYAAKYRHLHSDGNLTLTPDEVEESKHSVLESTMFSDPNVAAFDTMIQMGAKVSPPESKNFPLGGLLRLAGISTRSHEPNDLAKRETLLKLADRVIAGVKPEDWAKVDPPLLGDAVALNSEERLQFVYEKVGKAGIDFIDRSGRSAIDTALQLKAWDSFDFLIQKGATVKEAPAGSSFTRLMDRIEKGDSETIQKLLPHLKDDPEQINRVVRQRNGISGSYNNTNVMAWTAYDLALSNLGNYKPAVITELENVGAKGVPVEGLSPELAKEYREILELSAEGQLTRRQISEAAKKIYDNLYYNNYVPQANQKKNPALANAAANVQFTPYGNGALGVLNRANEELQRSVPTP